MLVARGSLLVPRSSRLAAGGSAGSACGPSEARSRRALKKDEVAEIGDVSDALARIRQWARTRLQAYPPEHFLSILVGSRPQRDWDVLVADVDWAVLSLPRPNQLSGVGRFPESEWAVVFRDKAVEIVVRR